jgi:phosphoserine phosphatase RsbU/P
LTATATGASLGLRRSALLVLLLVAGGVQLRSGLDLVRELRHPERIVATPFNIALDGTAYRVSPEASGAGLAPGDRVLSMQGTPYAGLSTLHGALRRARAGDVLRVKVQRRSGDVAEVLVPLTLQQGASSGRLLDRVYRVILGLFTPALCLALGFAVALLRPRDHRAWILLFLLVSLPHRTLWTAGPQAWEAGARQVGLFFHELIAPTWPVWMMLFGIYFPERLALDRRWPWLKWLFITPCVASGLGRAVAEVCLSEGAAWIAPWLPALDRLGVVSFFAGFTAIGLFFASIGFKSGTATNPDARRRLSLLLWGAAVSLTPTFVLILAGLFTRRNPFVAFPAYVVLPAVTALALFPVTLAYVIVVHQALDVRVVVRQGLQYALASRGVRVVQVLIIVAVALGSFTLLEDRNVNRPWRIIYLAIGVWASFLVSVGAQRLRDWVDRRFFREAYDAERVLTELSEDVRTMVEAGPLLETVVARVSETLHVPVMAAFVREDGAWRAASVLGEVPEAGRVFPEESSTVRRLTEDRQPLRVRLDDPGAWFHEDAQERERLGALSARLLLPLAVKDELRGFLVLGPKRSEAPYSPSDVRLLRSVAGQTALALENSKLTAAIARELAQRARMNREIEIAREVQEGLFPQHMPAVHGLEYAGYCRPARGVGGDYYDFVATARGGLGIAIGDVSGKGVPAALLMASLRAALRAQDLDGSPDLGQLVARLNRLIYEASGANRYATFFYGSYDPATRRLEYVNAGHNPPFVFRASTGEALRLEGGGPVVGLLPEAVFEAQSVTLEPGDLLVAYTDGVSEAMNGQDEEWGEDRMAEAVEADAAAAPETVVKTLMAGADAFASGAPQHDDMTLVVARVL